MRCAELRLYVTAALSLAHSVCHCKTSSSCGRRCYTYYFVASRRAARHAPHTLPRARGADLCGRHVADQRSSRTLVATTARERSSRTGVALSPPSTLQRPHWTAADAISRGAASTTADVLGDGVAASGGRLRHGARPQSSPASARDAVGRRRPRLVPAPAKWRRQPSNAGSATSTPARAREQRLRRRRGMLARRQRTQPASATGGEARAVRADRDAAPRRPRQLLVRRARATAALACARQAPRAMGRAAANHPRDSRKRAQRSS